jgi:hypothetical protein
MMRSTCEFHDVMDEGMRSLLKTQIFFQMFRLWSRDVFPEACRHAKASWKLGQVSKWLCMLADTCAHSVRGAFPMVKPVAGGLIEKILANLHRSRFYMK